MGTILWCYMRNRAFRRTKTTHLSAEPHRTGQAINLGVHHRGRHHQQKLAENNGAIRPSTWAISTTAKFDQGRIYQTLPGITLSIFAATR